MMQMMTGQKKKKDGNTSTPPDRHELNAQAALGVDRATAEAQLDPLANVHGSMAPMFLAHSTEDELLPVAQHLDPFRSALAKEGVSHEVVCSAWGGHGMGLVARWGEPLAEWLRRRGFTQHEGPTSFKYVGNYRYSGQ